ncbi:sulfotransferase [Pseudomonadota bacterium]
MSIVPNNVEAILQHCKALVANDRYAQAIEAYWRVLELAPDNAKALSELGQLLHSTHRYDELLKYCDHAEKVFPGHPKPASIRAKVLVRQGDWRRAKKILDKLLTKHAPFYELVTAYAQIARAAKAVPKAITLLETFIKQQGHKLPAANMCELYFSLGKLYDSRGEYNKAFANTRKANQLKHQGYDIGVFQGFVETVRGVPVELFTRESSEQREDAGRPVFIIGMPRSGTSLIEQVLDSHSQVFGAGELLDISQIERRVIATQGGARDSSEAYAQAMSGLTDNDVNAYAAAYLNHLASLDSSARYVTDKMPQNFMYLGLINRLFPNAHVIHCVRNPVDTCLSCYFQSFNQGHGYAYDLDSLAKHYRGYHEMMAYWKSVLNLPFFTLEYETLIERPKETIKGVLDFLDLPWEDGCMKHHKNPRLTATASNDQVRQPIYRRSVQRWKNYEAHITPLIEQLQDLSLS